MIPNLDRNSGEDPVIGIDDRTLYNTGSVQDPAGIDEELLDPFLTMVQNMLSAKETAQNQLQTLIESRLSQYGESDPAEYIKVRGRIRKHPGDRDRANAVKVNEDRAKMLALMFRDLARLGTYSHAVATEAHYKMADSLPGCRLPMRFVK
jgi:hypothetical protein